MCSLSPSFSLSLSLSPSPSSSPSPSPDMTNYSSTVSLTSDFAPKQMKSPTQKGKFPNPLKRQRTFYRMSSFLAIPTRNVSDPLDAWNLRFQRCIERLQSLDASCPIEERIEANIELMHLGEDFVHASRTVGKIIISEVETRT